MPSERYKIQDNINDSKNTRMDLESSIASMDFRKDEFMHLGRYFKACQTMVDLAKELGRPLRILDIGCGELWIPRTFYKSFKVKKSDIIGSYYGIDIDNIMLDKCKQTLKTLIDTCNIKLIRQDLTVNPKFKVEDGFFDLICWFENIEHMKPEFIPIIVKEVGRVLNPQGVALISTPNSNGSNAKLPKDHVYEWGYEELCEVLEKHLKVEATTGVGINISKIPKEEQERKQKLIDKVYQAFGNNTAFSAVALAPFFKPENCKNVLYICKKTGGIDYVDSVRGLRWVRQNDISKTAGYFAEC